jgi:hypothetical protein
VSVFVIIIYLCHEARLLVFIIVSKSYVTWILP